MISSSDFVLKTAALPKPVMQNILQIQEEIRLINKHETEHVTAPGELIHLDESCAYCKRHLPVDQPQAIHNHKKLEIDTTLNELERTAEASGRNAHVTVPRSWAGKRVKIILVEG